MRSRVLVALLAAATAYVASACGRAQPPGPSPEVAPTSTPSAPPLPARGRVVIIFCDAGACDSRAIEDRTDEDVAARVGGGADLLFVRLPDVDRTGHASEWCPASTFAADRRADDVGHIVGALPSDTTVLLTADHGRRVDGHSTSDSGVRLAAAERDESSVLPVPSRIRPQAARICYSPRT